MPLYIFVVTFFVCFIQNKKFMFMLQSLFKFFFRNSLFQKAFLLPSPDIKWGPLCPTSCLALCQDKEIGSLQVYVFVLQNHFFFFIQDTFFLQSIISLGFSLHVLKINYKTHFLVSKLVCFCIQFANTSSFPGKNFLLFRY